MGTGDALSQVGVLRRVNGMVVHSAPFCALPDCGTPTRMLSASLVSAPRFGGACLFYATALKRSSNGQACRKASSTDSPSTNAASRSRLVSDCAR